VESYQGAVIDGTKKKEGSLRVEEKEKENLVLRSLKTAQHIYLSLEEEIRKKRREAQSGGQTSVQSGKPANAEEEKT